MLKISIRKWHLASLVMFLVGCHSTTDRPIYSELLVDQVQLPQSNMKLADFRRAQQVIVVLSKSTRDTVAMLQEIERMGYPYQIDKWIASLVLPVKNANSNANIASELVNKPTDAWVVVVHWITDMSPGHHGAMLEYQILDSRLARVNSLKTKHFSNCDSADKNGHADCYDKVMMHLLDDIGQQF